MLNVSFAIFYQIISIHQLFPSYGYKYRKHKLQETNIFQWILGVNSWWLPWQHMQRWFKELALGPEGKSGVLHTINSSFSMK